jgi:hypothetical protein
MSNPASAAPPPPAPAVPEPAAVEPFNPASTSTIAGESHGSASEPNPELSGRK